jgi:hypothetical protein
MEISQQIFSRAGTHEGYGSIPVQKIYTSGSTLYVYIESHPTKQCKKWKETLFNLSLEYFVTAFCKVSAKYGDKKLE